MTDDTGPKAAVAILFAGIAIGTVGALISSVAILWIGISIAVPTNIVLILWLVTAGGRETEVSTT